MAYIISIWMDEKTNTRSLIRAHIGNKREYG